MKETVVKKHKVMQFICGWDFHVVCVFAILSSKYWKWIIWCNSYWLQLWLQGHFFCTIFCVKFYLHLFQKFFTHLCIEVSYWQMHFKSAIFLQYFVQCSWTSMKTNITIISVHPFYVNVFSKVHSYIFVLFYSSLFWKKLDAICSAFQLKLSFSIKFCTKNS